MQFLKSNITIFTVISIIIIMITQTSNSFLKEKWGRREKNIQFKLDSLSNRYKQLEFIHNTEKTNQRKIFLEDSLLKIKFKEEKVEDSLLIIKQTKALLKYKYLNSKQAVFKLDSAYNAEN